MNSEVFVVFTPGLFLVLVGRAVINFEMKGEIEITSFAELISPIYYKGKSIEAGKIFELRSTGYFFQGLSQLAVAEILVFRKLFLILSV